MFVIGTIIFFSYEATTWFGTELNAFFDRIFDRTQTTTPSETDKYMIGIIALFVASAIFAYVVIIPMLWSIYTAKEIRTFANYTRFDGAEFSINARAGSLVWLTLSNILLFIFTLSIAKPFIIQRTIRYVVDRMTLQGAIDIDRIQQSTLAMPKRGEGLADAFDLGAW